MRGDHCRQRRPLLRSEPEKAKEEKEGREKRNTASIEGNFMHEGCSIITFKTIPSNAENVDIKTKKVRFMSPPSLAQSAAPTGQRGRGNTNKRRCTSGRRSACGVACPGYDDAPSRALPLRGQGNTGGIWYDMKERCTAMLNVYL